MFAALADQICRVTGADRSTCDAGSVRHALVEYLRYQTELHEVISRTLEPGRTVELYLNTLAKSGTWGDGNILSAACSIYGRRIEVYCPGCDRPMIIGSDDETTWQEHPFLLGYVNCEHYVSLIRT
jgi:hypothetical protein